MDPNLGIADEGNRNAELATLAAAQLARQRIQLLRQTHVVHARLHLRVDGCLGQALSTKKPWTTNRSRDGRIYPGREAIGAGTGGYTRGGNQSENRDGFHTLKRAYISRCSRTVMSGHRMSYCGHTPRLNRRAIGRRLRCIPTEGLRLVEA
eukprot:1187046-Pyramimonas_sp.AAC.3